MIRFSNMESLSADKQKKLLAYAKIFDPLIQGLPVFDRIEIFSCCTEQYASPKVSVILPVYNVEKYLFHAIAFILNQTCREIEVICVDDCSTDRSLQILDFFALLDARVKVIRHEKNLYAGVARNTGMSQAKGKYLYFFDPDDWCERELLAEAIQSGEAFHSDLVILRGDSFDMESGRMSNIWGINLKTPEPFSKESYNGDIFSFVTPAPWKILCRREFIVNEKLFFQDLHNANDVYFSFAARLSAKRISYLKGKSLHHYRTNVKGSLQATKAKAPLCTLEAYRAVQNFLISRNMDSRYITDLQHHLAVCTIPYTLLDRSLRGEGFRLYYAELRDHFFEEFSLDQVQHFDNQEAKKIIQAVKKNAYASDFLLDMAHYYRDYRDEYSQKLAAKHKKYRKLFIITLIVAIVLPVLLTALLLCVLTVK